jgi:hypothetical protein
MGRGRRRFAVLGVLAGLIALPALAEPPRVESGQTADPDETVHPLLNADREALRREPRVRAAFAYSDDSSDFERYTSTVMAELSPWAGTMIRIQPLFTRFEQDGEHLNRYTLGGEVRQRLPARLRAAFRYRFHKPRGVKPTHELGGELGANPWTPLDLRVGGRYRAMVDTPLPYEDVAYLDGVGSGGATLEAIEDRTRVSEGYLAASLTPTSWSYVYAEGVLLEVDDGNDGSSASAGAGVDLLGPWGWLPGHAVTLSYNFYFLHLQEEVPEYFSPDGFAVHTPLLEWRWRPTEEIVLGAESGLSFRDGGLKGWSAGAFGRFPLYGPLAVEGRMFRSDDTEFRIISATVALVARFR